MWLFFGLPLLVFFVMGVIHASESIDKVKRNWNEYRCDPFYIPFAGFIRPDIGVEENFQHCMNMFGQSIFRFVIDAIMSMFKDLVSGIGELGSALPGFRDLFSKMRKSMLSFAAQTFGKITNSVGSITFILNKIRDILRRFAGEGYISIFFGQYHDRFRHVVCDVVYFHYQSVRVCFTCNVLYFSFVSAGTIGVCNRNSFVTRFCWLHVKKSHMIIKNGQNKSCNCIFSSSGFSRIICAIQCRKSGPGLTRTVYARVGWCSDRFGYGSLRQCIYRLYIRLGCHRASFGCSGRSVSSSLAISR